MVTQLASANQFMEVQSPYTERVYRVHVTARFFAEDGEMETEEPKAILHHTVHAWLAVADALHSGEALLPEPLRTLIPGESREPQLEPACTVWGEVRLNATYAVTVTVHDTTNPQDALVSAIEHLLFQKWARGARLDKAEATKPGPTKPEVHRPERNAFLEAQAKAKASTQEKAVQARTEPRLIQSTRDEVAHGETVQLRIARIEAEFYNRSKVWKFYPRLSNGREGQYPEHGLTIYADGLDRQPEIVAAWLADNVPELGDMAQGDILVTARVNVSEKNGKTYFNIQAVDTEIASDVSGATETVSEGDMNDIPF